MRKFLILSMMIASMSAFADFPSLSESTANRPSASEIASNRACFANLEKLGCGDPGEEAEHFKTCMREVYSTLDKGCQKLMDDLYQTH